MAMQYFEEILLHINNKKMERVEKASSDVLVLCEQLAGVSVYVGLLKHPKNRLERKRHPRVPWPRYSRKLTICHSRPRPFSC